MSDWHDEFAEPMHDTPADKDPLIAAMEAAGYTYDGLESTNDNLRFFGEGGQVITMGGWYECEEWLNGVVFDDPQVMNRVEIILHPERFPEELPFALWKTQWSRTITALTASSITFRNRTRRFRHTNVPMRRQSSLCLQS